MLTQIQNALAQRRVLALHYRASGREEATRREVEPLGLIYYGDHWHLIACCRLRQDFRDFRTDRMAELAVRTATFQPHEGFSVREYISSWRDKAQGVEVKVRFAPRAVERARRSWFAASMEEQRTKNGVVMSFPVGELVWVADWLLSFGTDAEVIAPAALRSLLAERAAALTAHHRAHK